MEWQTPKTDWQVRYDENGRYAGDYFEAEDYNRIMDNLIWLAQESQGLWPPFETPTKQWVTAESFGYASYINALEEWLESLVLHTADPGVYYGRRWLENGPAPTADDLNRMEKGALALYHMLAQQKQARPKLAIALNRRDF